MSTYILRCGKLVSDDGLFSATLAAYPRIRRTCARLTGDRALFITPEGAAYRLSDERGSVVVRVLNVRQTQPDRTDSFGLPRATGASLWTPWGPCDLMRDGVSGWHLSDASGRPIVRATRKRGGLFITSCGASDALVCASAVVARLLKRDDALYIL